MLHHYNYSTSLSHFLSYHQFEDQASNENEQTSSSLCEDENSRCKSNSAASNKSFTIAAILGLNSGDPHHHQHHQHHHQLEGKTPPKEFQGAVGLSGVAERGALGCGRLQLPAAVAVTGHHFNGCPTTNRHAVRGLKHMSSSAMAGKKSCKSKRVRTIFTPEQLERLEAEFERQQYMVGPERLYLAHTLQLTEAQVKVWFQNRRIKWRKHHLELTHQRLAVLKQQQILLDDNQPDVQDTNSSSTDT